MSRRCVRGLATALCVGLVALAGPAVALDEAEALGFGRTPPRLSFTDGEVSFLRAGAESWVPARVNTALAAGDALYVADRANLELQVGARAFVRAAEKSELAIDTVEPEPLRLRLAAGTLALDLRSLPAGQRVELDTPNASFGIEGSGYYRVAVGAGITHFTSRNGGRASATPVAGDPAVVAANEHLVVSGSSVASYAVPALDAWDHWNQARSDDQLAAASSRYVAEGVYGVRDLDHGGSWEIVPTYGAVWAPHQVGVGWVPYGAGRWMWDPWYAWTWVDDAPWGWAPFHYGRWVHVSGHWVWCPGPLVSRPYYAPALVAFHGRRVPHSGLVSRRYVGWVALGWGEPLIAWWGPSWLRRRAHWAGWGGPRIVNQSVVRLGSAYAAEEVRAYRNAGVAGAMLEIERDRFGRNPGRAARFGRARADRFSPLHARMDVAPDRTSLVPDARPARRLPPTLLLRPPRTAVPGRIQAPPRAPVVRPAGVGGTPSVGRGLRR